MQTFLKFLLSVFFIGFLFTSCSSDSENAASSDVLLKSLNATVLGNTNDYEFTYSGKKLDRINYNFFDGNVQTGYYKFQYSDNLITVISEFSTSDVLLYETTFTYSGNDVTQIIKKNIQNQTAEKISIETNPDFTISAKTFSGDFTNQTQLVTTETLTFINNKVSQKTLVSVANANVFNNTTNFSYDDKLHPLANVTGILELKSYLNLNSSIFAVSGLEGVQNNRISEFSEFLNGDNSQINFETEYNSNNFPVSKLSTINSSGNYEFLYTYF